MEKRARGYEAGAGKVRNAEYLDMSLPYAAGSLYSTVEDLYVWDQALYTERVLPAKTLERMFTPALEQYGYGWTIRKERVGPDKAERLTIAHGGGINGFNTLLARIPEDRQLIVLLNNTGGTNLRGMFEGITDILYGRSPAPPKRGVARLLYPTIETSGVAAAVAEYRRLAKNRQADLDMGESQLNRLGYDLLRDKRTSDAIEIFKLNAEAFPASANVYDSLAEAFAEAGLTDLAITNYEKAVKLDPSNRNAADRLKALMKQ
jgi:CubicO group peptidase (beta-lactamase class C family)